jgi:hypothetical protein
MHTAAATRPRHLRGWAGFWLWALAGAVLVVGLDIPPVLLVAGYIGLAAGWYDRRREAVAGIATGAGLPLLFVAYLNRHEPFDPWPWFAIGLCLVAAGLAWAARSRRG